MRPIVRKAAKTPLRSSRMRSPTVLIGDVSAGREMVMSMSDTKRERLAAYEGEYGARPTPLIAPNDCCLTGAQ